MIRDAYILVAPWVHRPRGHCSGQWGEDLGGGDGPPPVSADASSPWPASSAYTRTRTDHLGPGHSPHGAVQCLVYHLCPLSSFCNLFTEIERSNEVSC